MRKPRGTGAKKTAKKAAPKKKKAATNKRQERQPIPAQAARKQGRVPESLTVSEEMLRSVEESARKGLTYREIAGLLGVSDTTFLTYRKKYPEIESAVEAGRARGIEEATDSLWGHINGGNFKATEFYLKTKGKWTETSKLEVSGPDGGPLEVQLDFSRLSDAELARLEALLEKATPDDD